MDTGKVQTMHDVSPYLEPVEVVSSAERLARRFHESYEALAPEHGYKTREASAVPWDQVPPSNRDLMIATAKAVLDSGYREGPDFPEHLDLRGRITVAAHKFGLEHRLVASVEELVDALLSAFDAEVRSFKPGAVEAQRMIYELRAAVEHWKASGSEMASKVATSILDAACGPSGVTSCRPGNRVPDASCLIEGHYLEVRMITGELAWTRHVDPKQILTFNRSGPIAALDGYRGLVLTDPVIRDRIKGMYIVIPPGQSLYRAPSGITPSVVVATDGRRL